MTTICFKNRGEYSTVITLIRWSNQEEDDPLNSGDDDSDDAGNTEFEATDNVVVCLFDKVILH